MKKEHPSARVLCRDVVKTKSFLESPAEAEGRSDVGLNFEIVSADFALVLYSAAVGSNLGSGVHTETVDHAQADFSTEVQAFVDVEVDAGEGCDTEVVACVGITLCSVVDLLNFLIPVLSCLSGEGAAIADTATSVEVNSLVVEEVTLVAQVDVESTVVVLSPFVVGENRISIVVGSCFHALSVDTVDAELEHESVLVAYEVATFDFIVVKSEVAFSEGVEANFNAEVALLGSVVFVMLCVCTCDCRGRDGGSDKKLLHNCLLFSCL